MHLRFYIYRANDSSKIKLPLQDRSSANMRGHINHDYSSRNNFCSLLYLLPLISRVGDIKYFRKSSLLSQEHHKSVIVAACMLSLLNHHGTRGGLLNGFLRPSAPYFQRIFAQKAYHPHPSTSVPSRFIRHWSPKTPAMSRSNSTSPPRGAWDSHVHVVDEVSNSVQTTVLNDGRWF